MKEYIGRMTKRDDDGQVVMDCQNCELSKKYGACNSLACRDRMKERLAGYEDAADAVTRNAFDELMERYKKATGLMPNGATRQEVRNMRLIDADALKELRHQYIQGHIKFDGSEYDLIDKCPTIDAVEFKTLEAWLYEIAMNNTNTYLCDACEEIISRLDGLRVFAKELRSHQDSVCDQTEEE